MNTPTPTSAIPTPTPRRRTNWPETVHVLSASDISLTKDNSETRWPLAAWFESVFENSSDEVRKEASLALLAAVRDLTGYFGLTPPHASANTVAAAWNEAMRSLGYEIPKGNDYGEEDS